MTRHSRLPNVTADGNAHHLPAEAYRHIPNTLQPPDGQRSVVIFQAAPPRRSYVGPVLLVLASTAGACGVIFLLLELLKIAAAVVLAIKATVALGGGLTIAARRNK